MSPCQHPGYCLLLLGAVCGAGLEKGSRAVKDGFPALSMPAHFARNRKDIFHYVLFAHALSGPFDAAGHPLTADPSSVSGVADRPGGD